MITQKQLKSVLKYDPNTGVFIWRNDQANRNAIVGEEAGYYSGSYRHIRIFCNNYPSHRLAWLYMKGSFPNQFIDHINGIKDDNRWCNLREATNSENNYNQKTSKDNTSGVRGVTWDKNKKRWRVRIRVAGKRLFIGLFDNIDEARLARELAEIKHHGEFRPSVSRCNDRDWIIV